MRHSKKINHLGRTSSHRKAMLANMANSLIFHKRITTTLAKAKALRVYVEPLITKAKDDSTHSRRVVFEELQSKTAVAVLFRDVAEKVGDRPGGYTRILKTGTRIGDNAEMCFIELVDFNENMLAAKETKAKPGRSRRGAKKKASAATETAKLVAPSAKAIAEAEVVEPVEEVAEVEVVETVENATESEVQTESEDEKKTEE
jgi:large subunit ribosomal protein L17